MQPITKPRRSGALQSTGLRRLLVDGIDRYLSAVVDRHDLHNSGRRGGIAARRHSRIAIANIGTLFLYDRASVPYSSTRMVIGSS